MYDQNGKLVLGPAAMRRLRRLAENNGADGEQPLDVGEWVTVFAASMVAFLSELHGDMECYHEALEVVREGSRRSGIPVVVGMVDAPPPRSHNPSWN